MNSKELKIKGIDFAVSEDRLWVALTEFPKVLCIDMITGDIISSFDLQFNKSYADLYGAIFMVNEMLVCIPYWSERLAIIDVKKMKIEELEIPDNIKGEWGATLDCGIVSGNRVYAFPSYFTQKSGELNCLIYDVDSKELRTKTLKNDNNRNGYYSRAFYRDSHKNSISGIIFDCECVYEFNILNQSIKPIFWGKSKIISTAIYSDKYQEYIISSCDGEILLCDNNSNVIKRFDYEIISNHKPASDDIDHRIFGFSAIYGDNVYLFPHLSEKVISVDLKNGVVSEAFFSHDVCENIDIFLRATDALDDFKFFGFLSKPKIVDGHLYAFNLLTATFFIVNLESKAIVKRKYTAQIELDKIDDVFDKYMTSRGFMCQESEGGVLSLDSFLRYAQR